MIKFWSYKNEYLSIRKLLLSDLDKTLKSENLFFGNELNKFEKNFTKKNNLKYGAAVASGTDALIIALRAIGIKNGDEVITVSNTAIPTVSAIKSVGAVPVFVDINIEYLMDVNSIKNKITKKTKAIMPVHLYGKACEMDKIIKISKKYKLRIIEDCAQAQGAKYKGRNVGSMGDLGCFSFYPTKILGCYADGGFVSTNSYKIYKEIIRLRFYGIETVDKNNRYFKKYYSVSDGINSRLSEINATILNLKLKEVEKNIRKRISIARFYCNELKNSGLILPKIQSLNNRHVFHLFVVYHKKRNEIIRLLKKKGIEIRIHYPYPIHSMKANKKLVRNNYHSLKITDKMSSGIFSLPLYPTIKKNELFYIVKNIIKIMIKLNQRSGLNALSKKI